MTKLVTAPLTSAVSCLFHVLLIWSGFCCQPSLAGIPSHPKHFTQLVDHEGHFHDHGQEQERRSLRLRGGGAMAENEEDGQDEDSEDLEAWPRFWSQRYYANDTYFRGPGYPIFVVLGGESALEPSTGIVYPIVVNRYARAFGAYVVCPEHRFYGASQPLPPRRVRNVRPDPREILLTPSQALHDSVRLVDHVRFHDLGCSPNRTSAEYCPVVTVGGSYSGFLSAMARLRFHDTVDLAYAGSPPMKFYAQQIPSQYDYYQHISNVAEAAVEGCAQAVRSTLDELTSYSTDNAVELGICPKTVPSYIANSRSSHIFWEEILMVIGYTFANRNMAYYPPSSDSRLARSCRIFQNADLTTSEKLKEFFMMDYTTISTTDESASSSSASTCWNMTAQVPAGPHGTITGGDWSGVGWGTSGESWDFQTCTLCVEPIGFGPLSMFPRRDWSLSWLQRHCFDRFGVQPQPYKMVKEWGIDDLVREGATHILFTNGLNDGWSVSGIKTNLTDTLVAFNFPNGAHHSDLSGRGESDDDTPDIREGYERVQRLLGEWLEALPSYQVNNKRAIVTEASDQKTKTN